MKTIIARILRVNNDMTHGLSTGMMSMSWQHATSRSKVEMELHIDNTYLFHWLDKCYFQRNIHEIMNCERSTTLPMTLTFHTPMAMLRITSHASTFFHRLPPSRISVPVSGSLWSVLHEPREDPKTR